MCPEVLAQDLERGFLLLSDLGNTTYLQALDADNASMLYADAIAALIRIQRASRPGVLPEYDQTLLRRELDLFPSGIWKSTTG
jgi:aminoglycoside/choline kinase family phosphotransferase